jgi:hypothetical protein
MQSSTLTGDFQNGVNSSGIPGGDMILPDRNTNPILQVVGKNDLHEQSMISDQVFYSYMQQMNARANALTNLNDPTLTQAGDNAAENARVLVKEDAATEHWINSKWRPMMGWLYMLVCFMDFVGFPILWSMFQAAHNGSVTTPWQPLTLQGAGLFHLAMGAILGITAYGRTQEKIANVPSPAPNNSGS